MKVLLSAVVCRPGIGSEWGAGWNWALQMARRHEVWCLTSPNNRSAIEAEIKLQRGIKLHFVYCDLPGQETLWWKPSKWGFDTLFAWTRYYAWQWVAYQEARKLHAQIHFDLAHHVTFASWRVPSFLWRLGIPFIWGPVGGGQEIPRAFRRSLGPAGITSHLVRYFAQCISYYDPMVRATRRQAAGVLAGNRETQQLLARLPGPEPKIFPLASGETVPRGDTFRNPADHEPLSILWVGRIVPWKGLHLLIRALGVLVQQQDGGVPFHLTVVNVGPDMHRCQKLADSLGLRGRVSFVGRLPTRSDVLSVYHRADVFVFTSLCESLGQVLLEAMGSGLPVICLDHGGPGFIATPECGFIIDPRSEEYVVEKMAEAIKTLARDPALRLRMGRAALKRAKEDFSWDMLGERMDIIYREATNR